MHKSMLLGLILLPILANANTNVSDFNKNAFIGKWQCDIKNHQQKPTKQIWEIKLLSNGTMNERIERHFGQKNEYAYQIEIFNANSKWDFVDNRLVFDDYQIQKYSVRMPNAKKDDLEQAEIAAEKTLPIFKNMIGNLITKRQFDVDFINKRTMIKNDVDNQVFMACQKKGFGFDNFF